MLVSCQLNIVWQVILNKFQFPVSKGMPKQVTKDRFRMALIDKSMKFEVLLLHALSCPNPISVVQARCSSRKFLFV